MKFAIIGAQGQLGLAFGGRLGSDAVSLSRQQADLTRPTELRQVLQQAAPEIVINCSAYNLVDRAESEPEAAFAVNAWGVRELALACQAINARLIHFSTDYVFGLNTHRRTPWTEDDAPGPVSAYGLSKLTGEYWARQISDRDLVIRVCGLFGRRGAGGKGGNFVETMLRVAGEGKPLRVVDDQRCAPTYVGDVVEGTLALLASGATGLFHMTSAGDCSWHEFAVEIFRQTGTSANLTAIPSADYPTPARRPQYSVLALDRINSLGVVMPGWRDGLARYLRDRAAK
jgi:dTDP-4-dehydrorhamnose reductase